VRHNAKFHGDRSNQCCDVAIFQNGGRPPSWICVCLDHPRRVIGDGIYHCAKFGWNRCSSFDKIKVLISNDFGFKMPIHVPK